MKQAELERPPDGCWAPSNFTGLEVSVKRSPLVEPHPPSVLFDYRIGLNGYHQVRGRYGRESFKLDHAYGCVVLQNPGELLEVRSEGSGHANDTCVGVAVSKQLLGELHGDGTECDWRFRQLIPDEPENTLIVPMVSKTLQAFRRPTPLLEQQTSLLRLVEVVMRTSAQPADATVWQDSSSGSEPRAVTVVRDRFHTMPEDDHSMSDLAELTGLNARYLIRVFRQHTGLTPHRYLIAVRVHRSKKMLLAGRSLSSIATDLGFADQAHFTRVFKSHIMVTPGEFRRLSTR